MGSFGGVVGDQVIVRFFYLNESNNTILIGGCYRVGTNAGGEYSSYLIPLKVIGLKETNIYNLGELSASGSGTNGVKVVTGFRPKRLVLYAVYNVINSMLIYDVDFENNTNVVSYRTTLQENDQQGIDYYSLYDDGFTFTNSDFQNTFYYLAIG